MQTENLDSITIKTNQNGNTEGRRFVETKNAY